jgi:hypothetical protein
VNWGLETLSGVRWKEVGDEIPGSSSSAGSESSRSRFLSGGDSALSTKEALRLPRKDILNLKQSKAELSYHLDVESYCHRTETISDHHLVEDNHP